MLQMEDFLDEQRIDIAKEFPKGSKHYMGETRSMALARRCREVHQGLIDLMRAGQCVGPKRKIVRRYKRVQEIDKNTMGDSDESEEKDEDQQSAKAQNVSHFTDPLIHQNNHGRRTATKEGSPTSYSLVPETTATSQTRIALRAMKDQVSKFILRHQQSLAALARERLCLDTMNTTSPGIILDQSGQPLISAEVQEIVRCIIEGQNRNRILDMYPTDKTQRIRSMLANTFLETEKRRKLITALATSVEWESGADGLEVATMLVKEEFPASF